jgi:hypothetical protein
MYIVSWSAVNGCGNKSFNTPKEMDDFIMENQHNFRSYSKWVVTTKVGFVAELTPYTD